MLFASSIIPGESESRGLQFFVKFNPTIQNLLHIPAYALLSILLLDSLKEYQALKRKHILSVFGFCCVFGILNEIIQMAIPGRYAGFTDVALNIIGSCMGILIYLLVNTKMRKDLIEEHRSFRV
jgi:VanZ family protein